MQRYITTVLITIVFFFSGLHVYQGYKMRCLQSKLLDDFGNIKVIDTDDRIMVRIHSTRFGLNDPRWNYGTVKTSWAVEQILKHLNLTIKKIPATPATPAMPERFELKQGEYDYTDTLVGGSG